MLNDWEAEAYYEYLRMNDDEFIVTFAKHIDECVKNGGVQCPVCSAYEKKYKDIDQEVRYE